MSLDVRQTAAAPPTDAPSADAPSADAPSADAPSTAGRPKAPEQSVKAEEQPAPQHTEPAESSKPAKPARTRKPRRHLRTPVVPQMEEQDCGAACLAVVLGALGRRVTLQEASRSCGVSRDGVSAAAVARAAGRYGVLAKGRRIVRTEERLQGLDSVQVPSMVLVTGPHFAVFEGIKRGRVYVNDPSMGSYSATPAEFWDSFSGIAVGFEPGPDFEPGGQRFPLLRALGGRMRAFAAPLLLAVLLSVALAVPGVVAAFLLRAYLRSVVLGGMVSWALPLALASAAVAGTVVLGSWLQQTLVNRVLESMAARSSAGFLWRLIRLPGSFFHRRQLGGLVTRVQMNDGLAMLLSHRVASASAQLTAAAVHLGALAWLEPRLAVVPVLVAVLDVLALRVADRRRGGLVHRLHAEQHKRDGVAFAGVSAIETLKAEGAEDSFFRSWAGWQARAMETGQKVTAAVIVPLSLPGAFNAAATATVVVAGTSMLIGGSLSIGTLLAFLLLLNGFLGPVGQLVGAASELTMARAQNALLEDVESSEPDPYLTPVLDAPAEPGPRLSGALELRDLEFGYDPNRPPTLTGISLTIRPGEWVAVVGGSGSGKSTVARLAAGVLRPWSGQVLLDGRPRDDWHRAVVTAQVAYVEQQLRLFEGTVRENLTLWNPAADEDALHRALADAEVAELVARRGGLDAGRIDEDARNLSGGERQRLELARALALDPALLVLDEATSALDAHTEAAVNEHLRRRGTTCLVLAHRLSTIQAADRVVVLAGGRIVQQGTPAELATVPGPYQDLLTEKARQTGTHEPSAASPPTQKARRTGTPEPSAATPLTEMARQTGTHEPSAASPPTQKARRTGTRGRSVTNPPTQQARQTGTRGRPTGSDTPKEEKS